MALALLRHALSCLAFSSHVMMSHVLSTIGGLILKYYSHPSEGSMNGLLQSLGTTGDHWGLDPNALGGTGA